MFHQTANKGSATGKSGGLPSPCVSAVRPAPAVCRHRWTRGLNPPPSNAGITRGLAASSGRPEAGARRAMARGARAPGSPGKPGQGPGGQASRREMEDAAGQPQRPPTASRFPPRGSGAPLLAGPAARSQASSGARFSPLPLMSLPTAPALPENALHAPTTAPSFESTLLFVQIYIC